MSDNKLNILYEDSHIIAVIKPFGVLSQPHESKPSIASDISRYISEKSGSGYVGVVHRLDVTTGGVMVFAKTPKSNAVMCDMVRERRIHKTYMTVVSGHLDEKAGELSDFLYHDKTKNKTFVVKKERKGVKSAKLSYEVLSSAFVGDDELSLLKVRLFTGRTHQIRVQFASRRHPVVGDKKYGSKISNKTIALWAYRLEFCHPITGESITLTAKPQGGIFELFGSNLETL